MCSSLADPFTALVHATKTKWQGKACARRQQATVAYSSDEEGLVAELCQDDHDERSHEAVAEAQPCPVTCLGVAGRRILEKYECELHEQPEEKLDKQGSSQSAHGSKLEAKSQ